MPNQLPKNQSQNNFTSFRNEKHLNLLDSIPEVESSQEDRISNFVLFITIFLGTAVSLVTYLNITNTKTFNLNENTKNKIEIVKTREPLINEIKEDVRFLEKYKTAKESIKVYQRYFYNEINSLITNIDNAGIESITFNQENNIYNFKIIVFSSNSKLEEKLIEFQKNNVRFNSLKMESIEQISESNEFRYTFNGVIDGR